MAKLKRIEVLTAQQERDLVVYRDEWLAHGRSCEPSDRVACERVWVAMYAALGKPAPRVMWWDGPATGSVARTLMTTKGANLGANLRANLRDNLRANLWDNLRDNLRDNLWDNLRDNLWDNLRANLWDNLRDNLWDNLGANLNWWFWGQHEAYWPAWLRWPDAALRAMHTPDQRERLGWWLTLACSTGWWQPFEGVVMACERPARQAVDAQGRLHHETGAALLCRDGWPVYAWHGVRVPADVIERPEAITADGITTEANAEVRRVMLERFGAGRYVEAIGATREQADDYGELYRAPRRDDSDLVLVKVLNSTPEPDGTQKPYWLRVPPTVQSAREGVAWSFGIERPEDYVVAIET